MSKNNNQLMNINIDEVISTYAPKVPDSKQVNAVYISFLSDISRCIAIDIFWVGFCLFIMQGCYLVRKNPFISFHLELVVYTAMGITAAIEMVIVYHIIELIIKICDYKNGSFLMYDCFINNTDTQSLSSVNLAKANFIIGNKIFTLTRFIPLNLAYRVQNGIKEKAFIIVTREHSKLSRTVEIITQYEMENIGEMLK